MLRIFFKLKKKKIKKIFKKKLRHMINLIIMK